MKKIELGAELRQDAIRGLKDYFQMEKAEELSDFQAACLLEFILINIGPYIYNQGLEDAHALMGDRIEDIFGLEKHPGKINRAEK